MKCPRVKDMGNYFAAKLASVVRSPFLNGTNPENAQGGTEVSNLGPLQTLTLLGSFILALVSAAGAVMLAWEIWEFAQAIKRNDTNAKSDALKGIIAGSIMFFAAGILSFLGFKI